jgi:hypothetical protein
VRTVEIIRGSANDNNVPAAFVNGFTDGQAARATNSALTAYLRVGIDDYARGFRAGFFERTAAAPAAERPASLQVVNL